MSAPKIKLWGVGTSRTFRPIWAAEELGLEYELEPIGPRTGETQTEDYKRLTRKQKVPFLEDGDVRLSESLAISRYLISNNPSSNVWAPTTKLDRAKEDEWCCYIYGELDETSLYIMRRHGDLAEIYGGSPEIVKSCKVYAEFHLKVTANYLAEQDNVMPGGFGLADIMLVSCLDWARFYGLDVPESLLAYRRRIARRPAYRRAMEVNFQAFPQLEQMIGA